MELNDLDRRILTLLQVNSALSHAEVGERVGVSAASAWRRIKRLEDAGVIERRVALVDPAKAGLTIQVVVTVSLRYHGDGQREAFEEWVRAHPEVLECYALTGDKDYVLRVVVKDMSAYDHFLTGDLLHQECVAAAGSSIVLRQIKYTTALPIQSGSDV